MVATESSLLNITTSPSQESVQQASSDSDNDLNRRSVRIRHHSNTSRSNSTKLQKAGPPPLQPPSIPANPQKSANLALPTGSIFLPDSSSIKAQDSQIRLSSVLSTESGKKPPVSAYSLEPTEMPANVKKATFRDYLTLSILLLANLINYMDRNTVAGVLEDVQKYYGINNAQTGLLQTSFIVSYMLLSPVFGYLGDRYNRKWAMAGGILFWSLITLAASFVPPEKFGLFLFLRAMVGVGEASYSTIAPTIIADMFCKTMRTKALSIFYFAIPVGSGLGYIIGSKVAAIAGAWYWSLRVTPVLGVLCTIAVGILVEEPVRGASDGGTHMKNSGSFLEDIKYLMKHKSFVFSTLGFTCVAFVAGAFTLWAPLYIFRAARLTDMTVEMAPISLVFGIITVAAGLTGVSGGYFAAMKLRNYTMGADPIVCAVGLIGAAPFFFFALVLAKDNVYITWVLIFFGEVLLSLNWALVTDILLYTVIPTRRSAAAALQILISHAFGDAESPYLIGVLTDTIAGDRIGDKIAEYLSLQYSLYTTCFVCVIGGAFFLANALYVGKDKKDSDRWIKESNIAKNSNNASGSSLEAENAAPSTSSSSQEALPETEPSQDSQTKSLLSLDDNVHVIMMSSTVRSREPSESTHL